MRKRTMTRRVIMRALTHGEDRVLSDIPVQSFAMSVDVSRCGSRCARERVEEGASGRRRRDSSSLRVVRWGRTSPWLLGFGFSR
jgi:hypothetical protein